jgi:hypothetical protein
LAYAYSDSRSRFAVVAVFLFGLAPLARSANATSQTGFAAQGSARFAAGGQTLRKSLVIAEIALAVILVIGSGLMIAPSWKLQQVKTGFDSEWWSLAQLESPDSEIQKPRPSPVCKFARAETQHDSGVASVSIASGLPPLRRIQR